MQIKAIKDIIRSRVAKNGIWLLLLQLFNTVVPMMTVPYVTRILSPEGYGRFSSALNWIVYLRVVVEYGFDLYGAREIALAKSDNEICEITSSLHLARLFLLGIDTLCLIVLVTLCADIELKCCIITLYLLVIGSALQSTWFFQGKQDMKVITVVSVIARSVSVVLIFSIIRDKSQLLLYCFLYAFTYILSGILNQVIIRIRYNVKTYFVKPKLVRDALRNAFPLFVSSAVSKLFSGCSITVLTLFATAYAVGIFSAISKIPLILNLLFLPVSQAIYPYISELHKVDEYKCRNTLKQLYSVCIVLFSFVGGIIIVFREQVIGTFLGVEYVNSSLIVVPMIIQTLIGITNNFTGIQMLVASGHSKEYSKAITISMLFIAIFDLLAILMVKSEDLLLYICIVQMIGEIILLIQLVYSVKRLFIHEN